MTRFHATAPGKVILFGEHAVVYGRPAIAVPVLEVGIRAEVERLGEAKPSRVTAPLVGLDSLLRDLPPDHHLVAVIQKTAATMGVDPIPPFKISITGTLPVAAGLGSGAAVSASVIRALAMAWGGTLSDEQVNKITFEIEKIHHGTPSGIDNTVITFARPVYFVRDRPIETFQVREPFRLLIADSGISSPTSSTVGDVRKMWLADKTTFEGLFDEIGNIVKKAKRIIEGGSTNKGLAQMGRLMNKNHKVLKRLGVSSPKLDLLVNVSLSAGALGAKMSGGGRGGNIIVLVGDEKRGGDQIKEELSGAGAVRVIETVVR